MALQVDTVVNDQTRTLLEESLDKLSEKQSLNSIIYEGQIYDAYSVLIDILNEANNSIIIIDNYIFILANSSYIFCSTYWKFYINIFSFLVRTIKCNINILVFSCHKQESQPAKQFINQFELIPLHLNTF